MWGPGTVARLPDQDSENEGTCDPETPSPPVLAGGTLCPRDHSGTLGCVGLDPHPPSGAGDLPPGVERPDLHSGSVLLPGAYSRGHPGGHGRPLCGGWGGAPFRLCPGGRPAPGPNVALAGAGVSGGPFRSQFSVGVQESAARA